MSDYWENFYAERDQVWSGKPNELLVREVSDLTPGAALDLGCAEGADAVWLAGRGWRVTGVDVSRTALERAEKHAREAGVEVTWEQRDLANDFPDGVFDLVCAQYLHSPVAVDGERAKILRRAAEAVAPGGTLLIVGHAGHEDHCLAVLLPSTDEVLVQLGLDDRWVVVVQEEVRRGERLDNVLRIRRVC